MFYVLVEGLSYLLCFKYVVSEISLPSRSDKLYNGVKDEYVRLCDYSLGDCFWTHLLWLNVPASGMKNVLKQIKNNIVFASDDTRRTMTISTKVNKFSVFDSS